MWTSAAGPWRSNNRAVTTLSPTSSSIAPADGPHAAAPEQPTIWQAARPRHPWLWLAAIVIAIGWDRAIWLAINRSAFMAIEGIEGISVRQAVDYGFSWQPGEIILALQYLAYHAIKLFGTVYLSGAIAAAIILRAFVQPDAGRVRIALRRGVLLFLSTAAAGLVAEVLKLIFRRQRPEADYGHYRFRFSDWFNASGLGLPSSHAAVAVAAALALSILYPNRRPLWIGLGGLCVLSRIAAGAHFSSDVVVGVLVGLVMARAVVALDLRNNQGRPVPG